MKYSIVIIILITLSFYIQSCQKDEVIGNNDAINEVETELRDGTKLPIFYGTSFTTDNQLLAAQQGYKNTQELFNKLKIDSVLLFRTSNSGANFQGTIMYPYKVIIFFKDTTEYSNLYFAKSGGLQYKIIPTGTNELASNNPEKYISITKEVQTQTYYNFTCGANKTRFLYTIQTLTNQTQEYLNGFSCATSNYKLNHQF